MNLALPYKEKQLFIVGALFFLIAYVASLWLQQFLICLIPFTILAAFLFIKDIRLPFYILMMAIPVSYNLEEQIHFGLDFPDEPLMLILTASFLFFILLNHKKIDWKVWFKNPLVILILITFLWTAISVIFSMNPIFSSKYLVKRIWYLVPFLFLPMIFFHDKKMIERAFTFMFLPLFAIVLLVLYRFSALGFRFEDVHDPVQPFFLNHVMYGSMISCFVPLIAGAFFLSKRLSFKWLFLFSAILIFLIGIYFSYSRAAWAAVVFAIVTMVCIRFKVMHYVMLFLYGIILCGVLWLSNNNQYLNYRPKFEKTIMHASLADHIMATLQGTDISSAERYYRWIAAIRMSVDHPVTGVGPNNFYEYYKQYTITSYRTWVSRNLEHSTTHNYFLYMLVEQGYPALILYALLILFVFIYGQNVYHRQTERFNKVVVMSCLCMISAVFINNFFSELLETDKIGSLFLLGIAVIIVIDQQKIKTEKIILAK